MLKKSPFIEKLRFIRLFFGKRPIKNPLDFSCVNLDAHDSSCELLCIEPKAWPGRFPEDSLLFSALLNRLPENIIGRTGNVPVIQSFKLILVLLCLKS